MLNKFLKFLNKDQKGITGLETAIILIAFVVVAAVFAYTALSAGLFSTQKSQEAVYSGLEEAQSSMELKGGVLVEGIGELDDCNTAWTQGTNITTSADASVKVEGSASTKCLAAADIVAAQVLATKTLTANRDLTYNDIIYFWVRSSAGVAGDATKYLTLTLTDDGGDRTSALATVGALTADTWKKVSWDVSALTAAEKDTISAVKLSIAGSDGTLLASGASVYIDIVETKPIQSISYPMKAYGDHAVFTVANVFGGEPIDFTITTDADADGIISDESTKNHRVTITYNDQYQTVTEIAWTKTAVGNDDTDDMLEANEKFQITVDLSYINNNATADSQKIGADRSFTLEIKPANGAVMVIERTMPNKITAINNVN